MKLLEDRSWGALEEGINSPDRDLGYLQVNVWIITLTPTPGSSALRVLALFEQFRFSHFFNLNVNVCEWLQILQQPWKCILYKKQFRVLKDVRQSAENKFGKAEIGFFPGSPAICQLARAASFFCTAVSSQRPTPDFSALLINIPIWYLRGKIEWETKST